VLVERPGDERLQATGATKHGDDGIRGRSHVETHPWPGHLVRREQAARCQQQPLLATDNSQFIGIGAHIYPKKHAVYGIAEDVDPS
jgi:hypothetical protein